MEGREKSLQYSALKCWPRDAFDDECHPSHETPDRATVLSMAKAIACRSPDDVAAIAVAIGQLTEEARLLRISLDELRDDVVWAARQVLAKGYEAAGVPPPPPRDPLAPDIEPAARSSVPPSLENAMDGDAQSVDGGTYCCDQPRLEWNGDPDTPGVACANCGYVIAENGSVVIWRDESDAAEAADRPAEPEQRQGSLF